VEELQQDVLSFIAEHIDSVVQLEALLFLAARAQADCTPAEVARELRIAPAWAEAALAKLAAAGILQVSGQAFRYAPQSQQTADTIATLAQAYEDRRVTVISTIFSKPPDPIKQFTDAFRLRKEQKD
jgi:hypothetical protein